MRRSFRDLHSRLGQFASPSGELCSALKSAGFTCCGVKLNSPGDARVDVTSLVGLGVCCMSPDLVQFGISS